MAIITNIDKLRIREIEENLANDKVLTIDSTGLVAWKNQDEITPDLSAYYTKDEIDALLEGFISEIKTDISLFFNNETKELRSNIGETEQRFIYSDGSEQEFLLTDAPCVSPRVSVQGVLLDWLTQFSIDVQSKKITILDELEEGDLINIQYKFIITN